MLKLVFQDLGFINKNIYKRSRRIINFLIEKRKEQKEKVKNSREFFEVLIKKDGAKQLGGIFLGEKDYKSRKVNVYKLEGEKVQPLFIAYIYNYKENTYKVLLEDKWENIETNILTAFKTDKKVLVNTNKVNPEKDLYGRFGRKRF